MTTISQINKAIHEAGINGKIVKGKGYYYFIGDLFDRVKSVYCNDLRGWETTEMIEYIKFCMSK